MADTFATATITGGGSVASKRSLVLTATAVSAGTVTATRYVIKLRSAVIVGSGQSAGARGYPRTAIMAGSTTMAAIWGFPRFVTEATGFTDFAYSFFSKVIEETFYLDDTIKGLYQSLIEEYPGLSADVSTKMTFQKLLLLAVSFDDSETISWPKTVAETVFFDDTNPVMWLTVGGIAAIAEGLVLEGSVSNTLAAYELIADVLALADVTKTIMALDETAFFDDTQDVTNTIYRTLLETMYMATQGSQAARLYLVVEETPGVDEVPTTQMVARNLVSEGVDFSNMFLVPDVTGTAWVLNVNSQGVSQYDNYFFNSFAVRGTDYLGATETGIYSLSGDDDAGSKIAAKLRTGLMQFATSRKKRVSDLYIGYRSDGRLVMKAIYNMDNTRSEAWYELTETSGAYDTARFKIGKGAKARYWAFELINQDGADFELDELEMFAVPLNRRL